MKDNYQKLKNKLNIPKLTVSDYEYFTGGGTRTGDDTTKLAPFAIYYNIALENIYRIESQLLKQPKERVSTFWAEYLWKAHIQSKNTGGYVITINDITIIAQLFKKAKELRDYHSHIWHDNTCLQFDNQLRSFIEQKYNEAKARLYKDHPGIVMDFENILQKRKGKYDLFDASGRIKPEGRAFFLSFFLTTGQMNSFLQQRVGYKRNNLPLYKMTRLLYTEYCHRDGASSSAFNHDKRVLNTLSKDEQANILKARSAFKLISYLVDYPDYWGNHHAMPLIDKNGNQLQNVAELKDFIEERDLLPGLKFHLIENYFKYEVNNEKTEELRRKEQEDKYRTGAIAFRHDEIPNYTFQINFTSLHRFVLLKLLPSLDQSDPLMRLSSELKKLAELRKELYRILTTPIKQRKAEDIDFLRDKKNHYLRGNRRLTETGVQYFENLEKGNYEKYDDAIKLANLLRNDVTISIPLSDRKGNSKFDVTNEHIQVFQQDYIMGNREKFRAGNRFVFYVARFLIDFAGDNWYWCLENFQSNFKNDEKSSTKVKAYFKSSEVPLDKDYRLTLENGHILIGIPKNEEFKRTPPNFYQFAFGPKALRYLTAFIVNNDEYSKKITGFLETLILDIKKLATIGKFSSEDDYLLLERPFVPAFMTPNNDGYEQLKQKLINRIGHIETEWDKALDNLVYLSRAEKNRLVMKTYRLFDWAIERADGKFLRANEYNELSICHYCLHLRESNANKRKTMTFEHLFKYQFKLNQRQPPLPRAIEDLLFSAESLDDLLKKVIADRRSFLINKLSLPTKYLKKELPSLCKLVGITITSAFLDENNRFELNLKQNRTFEILPYSIHPMLVFKYFFPEKYQLGKNFVSVKNTKGIELKKRPLVEVFANIRKNKGLRKPLVEGYYDLRVSQLLYPDANSKYYHKLNGMINDTCTEDILLWWITKYYLKKNDYTSDMAVLNTSMLHFKLKDLHKLKVTIELIKEKKSFDTFRESIFVSLRIHQFDDMMFMTEKSLLRKAALHFKRRVKDEKGLWAIELAAMNLNSFQDDGLPNGSKQSPIPYELLRYEIDLVHRTGQKLADYILAFEKRLLQKKLENKFNNNEYDFQEWLKSEYTNLNGSLSQKAYINFKAALKLADNEFADNIKEVMPLLETYRSHAFHDDIPINGSYSWFTREGQPIRLLLNITQDLHAKRDNSFYLADGDLEQGYN